MSRRTIAFTSGCFDDLHEGHIHLIKEMRQLADHITIALNSDDYIRRRKHREPICGEIERRNDLYNTALVDQVLLFDEDDPLLLILNLKPDFIVVGDDYSLDQVVGSKEVVEWGGKIVIVPRLPGYSTSQMLISQR